MNLSRRGFLAAGAGVTFGIALAGAGGMREAQGAAAMAPVNTWLAIGTDNSVTLTIGATEMGQGSYFGLAQVLCEDLMVDPRRVNIVQGGPTLASPAPIGTAIATVGSSVTRSNFWRMRDAGAIARETLVQAAMNQLGDSNRANYTVTDGVIRHSSGQQRTYGQVAADAARLTPPSSAPLVPDDALKVIGQSFPRPDITLKVDGSAKYGIDAHVPNMAFAAIKHCPTLGGSLATKPSTPAGAIAVVPVAVPPGNGRGANTAGLVNAVAVVAATTWDAMQAARRLSVSWTLPAAAANWNSAQFLADGMALLDGGTPYAAGAANPPGTVYTVESSGDARAAYASLATRRVEAVYQLPYVAHACMEVLSCTVDYRPGVRCEIWAPTQVARSALALVTTLTGLSEQQVVFHTTLLGGGLGRKAENDFIGQAVQVAMALGRPVQLMWPREEDFCHDQYRPMAVVRVRGGLDAAGNIVSWSYRNVSPSILGQRGANLGSLGDSQGYEASQALPYAFANRLTEWASHPSPVPVGFWRSVGASINTFAVESMVDELALAAGQDPLQFRRARISDPRWLAVLEAAASASGWTASPPAGTARGIAVGAAFNSIVATVAELATVNGTPTLRRVTVALDCYLTVNPANVKAQIAGGVVHGINAALYGQQTFLAGVAQRRNFTQNRMIRLQETPEIRVILMPRPAVADRRVPIGGVGELGVPTLAPAIANAAARLLGVRLRSLPFFPNAVMGGL